MTENDGRPGEGNRAAADDDLPESGQADDSRRRGDVPWADRHRSRVDRIFAALDIPAVDHRTGCEWSASELRAFERAAAHLRGLGLYGSWQRHAALTDSGRCQRCPCQRQDA